MQGLSQIDELLVQLQSVDNDTRTFAERNYESLPPSQSLELLLQHLSDSSFNKENRIFAAVLARRIITNKYEDAFKSQNEDNKSLIKKQLIELIIRIDDYTLKKKVVEISSQLALEFIDGETGTNNWPEYLRFMIECSQSEDLVMREISCLIFETIPHIFGNEEAKNLVHINQWLTSALQDPSTKVKEAAVSAMSNFLSIISDEPKSLNALSSLAPVYLMCIEKTFSENQDNETIIGSLVEVAENVPKFIKPYLPQTLQLCMNVMKNTEVSDSIRNICLESVITISESMPVAIRKQAGFIIEPLVSYLLMMMTDFEDDEDWDTDDDPNEEDEDSNAITAEMALDRFACALSNKQVLQVINDKVPEMLNSGNWKYRVAGLIAISSCAEGCMKEMEKLMSPILDVILPKLTDPHPRVRYAGCNTIGQMCIDFGPKMQKLHHSTVIPALMSVLDDSCPRVQAIGGSAVVYFCDKTPKNIINTYLDPMIDKLHRVMAQKFDELVKYKKKLVLQQIVTTVASIADSVQEHFSPYYEKFMPVLKFIMQQANDKELRMLRGKTIECISLIGLAVGKEKFAPDVEPIMELLLTTHLPSMSKDETDKQNGFMQRQGETLDPDDPQISFMIGAWARICKLMGSEFQKYLPIVIPQVLETAAIKPDVCIVDNEQAQNVDEEVDWHVVKLNQNQNFAIRTSGLEDKSTACRLLLCFAKELKEGFAPYCEKVLEIMLPTLRFYFNDEVREAAAEIMPYILDSIKLTNMGQVNVIGNFWNKICSSLLEAISNEPDRVLISSQLEALAGCVEILGDLAVANNNIPGLVTEHQLTEFHSLLDRMFHEHFEKDEERSNKRKGDDYDEIEEDRLQTEREDDEYVLTKMYSLVRAIFATHKSKAISFFQLIMNHCIKLMEPSRPHDDLQWGICFWADLIEFCPQNSWPMREYFIPVIIRSVNHTNPEVRQNMLLTVGMLAMFGPTEFIPTLSSLVPTIIQQIESQGSRDETNNISTENAIAAITKMMKYRPECLSEQVCGCNQNLLLAKWLTWLPVWEDDVETEYVYKQLCDLVEANNPVILGENNCNLPHIVSCISYAITMEGITEETGVVDLFGHSKPLPAGEKSVWKRCVSILRQVYSDQSIFQTCINQLDDAQRKSIASALKIIN